MPDITLTIVESAPVNLTIENGPDVNLTIGGGASAYQIWIDAGNTGTEADFLASLVGADGPTYSAGTGIDITGTTITNDAPNVVQTLSIAGQDLTLSGGGGTVAIPGGSISFPLLAPDGSVSAPSYSFANSAGTGLYYTGSAVEIKTADQGAENAKNLTIQTGEGTSQNGGFIGIFAGNSTGRGGGGITMRTGNSVGRPGGAFNLTAGDSDGDTGGSFVLSGGYGIAGGQMTFSAGNGSSNGGDLIFNAGISDADQAFNGRVRFFGNGTVLPNLIVAERDNIDSPEPGQTIFCTDATATDSSTGVMQVYNGSTWKNAW